MVEALAIYFRYSISDKNNIITLREELKNLDNYIKIQTFRFGDRFIMENPTRKPMTFYLKKYQK